MPPARRSNAAAILPSASRKLSLDAAPLDAPAKRVTKAQLPQESDDEDSDEAPEAQSNEAVRESVAKRVDEERSAIKSQKAARARAAQAREAAAVSKSKKQAKAFAAEGALDDAAASSSAPSSSASRLDPALFASVFAAEKPLGGASSSAPTAKELEERRRAAREARREEREQLKRAGGVVRGRDGEPMKRLKDGRTVVRALVPLESEAASDGEERLAAPTSGPTARPDAKARAFLKRRLGMAAKAEAPAQKKKPKKTTDDPLGLEDPAFMPGGEFYKGKSLTGKRARGGGAKAKPKVPGARTSASRSLGGPRGGPALAFAAPL